MYKLSDKAISLISSVIKDSNKKDYKITKKNELMEFCFVLSLAAGIGKKNEDTSEKRVMINSVMEEISKNIEDIDYEYLNQRLK